MEGRWTLLTFLPRRGIMKKLNLDAPTTTADEATEFCVHHLRLAAMYFEAVPDDKNRSLGLEIIRQCKDDSRALEPALVWATAIYQYYDRLKREN